MRVTDYLKYSRKKKQADDGCGHAFFEKKNPVSFRFVALPLEIPDKTKPGNPQNCVKPLLQNSRHFLDHPLEISKRF